MYIESENKSFAENLGDKGEEMIEKIKESIKKGNVTKITVKKDGNVIMNIPITAGAIGTVISPEIAILGAGAALLSKCTFEIIKEDGEVININEAVGNRMKGDS